MVGQQRLIENLTHYEINTFPHSLLLSGDEGSGKHTFIYEYISPLLTFPIMDITSEINIETINTIILSSQATIYIIDCDKISTREQNILLKFLEEPTPNAYIILLSTNTNLIIDTVLNRCQIWTMDKYSDEELLQFTQNASLLSIARTPGRVKLFEQVNVVAIQDLCDKLFNFGGEASIANILSISDKIDWKDNPEKLNFDVFCYFLSQSITKMVKRDSSYYVIYLLTNKFLSDITVLHVDKRRIFEKYLIDLRNKLKEL